MCRIALAILSATARSEVPRLTLPAPSIEPMDWTADLLALFAYGHTQHPRLARHAHLPLQSGSDTILRKMHRRYRPWHYAEKLHHIRSVLPDAAIGADIMVGFPGESDALFQESYDFIAAQPFTYLHLFPFSARPGTSAEQLHRERPVPHRIVDERMTALRTLAHQKNVSFRHRFLGRTLSAVTLKSERPAATSAISDNFLKIEIETAQPPNRTIQVQVRHLHESGLRADLLSC